jgi:hypothetical protein
MLRYSQVKRIYWNLRVGNDYGKNNLLIRLAFRDQAIIETADCLYFNHVLDKNYLGLKVEATRVVNQIKKRIEARNEQR